MASPGVIDLGGEDDAWAERSLLSGATTAPLPTCGAAAALGAELDEAFALGLAAELRLLSSGSRNGRLLAASVRVSSFKLRPAGGTSAADRWRGGKPV